MGVPIELSEIERCKFGLIIFISVDQLITISDDSLTVNNKAEHSKSENTLDGNEGTCFGLKDCESNVDKRDDVSLYLTSTSVRDLILKVKVKNATDCSVFRQEVIVSTLGETTHVCPHLKQCEMVNNAITNDLCTMSCSCLTHPCLIYLWFTAKSEAKICEIIWN